MAPGAVLQTPTYALPVSEITRPTKQAQPVSTPVTSLPSTNDSSKKPNFHNETDRLRSFGSWPSTAPVPKDKIARAGFYYLGSGLEVACPFCKLEIGDWNCDDIALRKHRERSPTCPFVLKQDSSDVPIEQVMKSRKKRFETFAQWPKPKIDPQRLVNAGFYYLKEGDKVRCAWCKGVIGDWTPTDVPFDEHAKNFAFCPFILNPPEYALRGEDECGHRSMSSYAAASAFPDGVIPHSAAIHPFMVSSTSRMNTFELSAWPSKAKVHPKKLVKAGFFFLGMLDYTKCFVCDGGLCNWEEGDDPWVEHARWFPRCNFVRVVKGEAFVKECRTTHVRMVNSAGIQAARSSVDTEITENLSNELDAIMSSSAVHYFLKNGVFRPVVRMTLKKFMIENERGFRSHEEVTQVLSQLLNVPKKPAPPTPKQEKSTPGEISEELLCRVCMAQERAIVFLPCRHLVTCPSCAVSVTECVVCRTTITGTLQTFLS